MKTPLELIDAISTVSKKLKLITNQKGHYKNYLKDPLYLDFKAKTKRDLEIDEKILKIFRNFVYNIPSDLYRILHPKKI